jgi:hypothetical protein
MEQSMNLNSCSLELSDFPKSESVPVGVRDPEPAPVVRGRSDTPSVQRGRGATCRWEHRPHRRIRTTG